MFMKQTVQKRQISDIVDILREDLHKLLQRDLSWSWYQLKNFQLLQLHKRKDLIIICVDETRQEIT